MKRIIMIAIAVTIPMFACTDDDAAIRTLEATGYTQITVTGYDMFACGKGDQTCTGFTAKGPTGKPVTGAVGCGLVGCSKGCTVRLSH